MDGTVLHRIAAEIKLAQDQGSHLMPVTDRWPAFDNKAAYEVAHRVHKMRLAGGAMPVGRKIGFTNPAMWSLYGVNQPVWAYVYDGTVRDIEASDTTVSLRGMAQPKIEPEIVLHFSRPVPAAFEELDDILACVDWVAHGFELVQCHYPDWTFKAPDAIADASFHAKLLIGPRRPASALPRLRESLASLSLDLVRDGELQESGRGANVLGSPLAATGHLARSIAGAGGPPIEAGELVTTGTLTRAFTVNPGERWSTRIAGIDLPGLSVSFVA